MNAISVLERTKYDCNLLQKGPNIIARSKFVAESRDYDFWTNYMKTNLRSLQSYLVLFEIDCNHK